MPKFAMVVMRFGKSCQGHNKELTQLKCKRPEVADPGKGLLTQGNLGLSFSSDHVASVTAQHEAGTFIQCRFFRHAGQLQCRVRAARAKTVLLGG